MKHTLFLVLLACTTAAVAADPIYVPDPSRTPGAFNPDITLETFHQRICVEGAAQYRPSASYTTGLKKKQLRDFNCREQDPSEYEEDHLIPLSLGGHPRSPKNLWPQPWHGEWGAHKKDRLEFALYKAACKGEITLTEARAAFTPDWRVSYRRYETLIKKYRHKSAPEDDGESFVLSR
ncbi:hypothetical protein [Piscinibacter sp.]|jgi:hypothetical protein|uniref:hypothetical protein n=1 Tax=Piscinibacter sp. TaxID=1903157 RepID=UPI003559EC9F